MGKDKGISKDKDKDKDNDNYMINGKDKDQDKDKDNDTNTTRSPTPTRSMSRTQPPLFQPAMGLSKIHRTVSSRPDAQSGKAHYYGKR